MDPIKVFISCSPVERIPALVLKHTIEKNAISELIVIGDATMVKYRKCDVRLTYECGFVNPDLKGDARPRTNFSYHRFCVPKACDYKGRAISMDSDMLVFGDMGEIFDAPMVGCNVLSACPIGFPHQNSSVMCIDCEDIGWDIEYLARRIMGGALDYRRLMRLEDIGVMWKPVNHNWNCLDAYTPGVTKNLHFTDMSRQPWLRGFHRHHLSHLWSAACREALDAGAFTMSDLEAEVRAGHLHSDVTGV